MSKDDDLDLSDTHETAWDRYKKNRAALVGAGIITVILLVAVFAELLAPYSPYDSFADGLTAMGGPVPPGPRFILGTDNLGRDVLSRLIFASRISLQVGVIAAGVSLTLGTLIGVVAGYCGRWIDLIIMRITDAMLAFPFLLFVILVVAILRPSVTIIYVVIGILGWSKTARIARGQTLSIMQNAYVEAARSVGASFWHIILRHIIPNIMGPIIVFGTLQVGNYVLTEGALSYMGVGVPPPIPSWGSMIFTGQKYYNAAPWLIIFPGLMLTLTVIGFNLVGDGLDDSLNPRN
jgi:ABC-type dipeptide/oligopeptide/nickel transport system permease subunit